MSAQRNSSGTPAAMRNIFGIIMIIIYVGVGISTFSSPLGNGCVGSVAACSPFMVFGVPTVSSRELTPATATTVTNK